MMLVAWYFENGRDDHGKRQGMRVIRCHQLGSEKNGVIAD